MRQPCCQLFEALPRITHHAASQVSVFVILCQESKQAVCVLCCLTGTATQCSGKASKLSAVSTWAVMELAFSTSFVSVVFAHKHADSCGIDLTGIRFLSPVLAPMRSVRMEKFVESAVQLLRLYLYFCTSKASTN